MPKNIKLRCVIFGNNKKLNNPNKHNNDIYKQINRTNKNKNNVQNTRRRRRRNNNNKIIIYIVIICVIIVVGIMLFMRVKNNNPYDNKDNAVTSANDNQLQTKIQVPIETTVQISKSSIYKDFSKNDIYIGDLILVNDKYKYFFPEKENNNNIPIYGNKTSSYKVRDTTTSANKDVLANFNKMMDDFNLAKNKHDILVVSAYRDFESQKQVYDERVMSAGEEAAALYVATPGYSEHHTGYAFDLGVYTDDKRSLSIEDGEEYLWINENCHKYGFVLRYKNEKIPITGIGYEPWHYRYVGKPHAYIMEQNNLCLEEYIDYIKKYTYNADNKKHLLVTDDEQKNYEIYYFKASDKDTTGIPIPEDNPYTISGNNTDGFIITIEKP